MKKVLFIGAHVDDIEISCAGTISKLLELKIDVHCWSASHLDKKHLIDENSNSMCALGVINNYAFDYPVRMFYESRQNICQQLYDFQQREKFDTVFTHDINDNHRDHSVIGEETMRAFKSCRILTYCSPFNSLNLTENFFVQLDERHIEKKLECLSKYDSQAYRAYMKPEYVRGYAITRGIQGGSQYAEAFNVVRYIV